VALGERHSTSGARSEVPWDLKPGPSRALRADSWVAEWRGATAPRALVPCHRRRSGETTRVGRRSGHGLRAEEDPVFFCHFLSTVLTQPPL
jgi:hypothetical protein